MCLAYSIPGYAIPGHGLIHCDPLEIPNFAAGYAIRTAAIFSPIQDGFDDYQLQEPCPIEKPGDPARILMFYAGMKVNLSAIYSREALKSDPATWTNETPLLDVTTMNSFYGTSFAYIRLNDAWNDGTLIHLLISSDLDGIWEATAPVSDPETFTLNPTPILTSTSGGRNDGAAVSLAATALVGNVRHMVYAIHPATVSATYLRATKTGGGDWVKAGGTVLAAGGSFAMGIEWHSLRVIGDTFVLAFEGFDPAFVKCYVATGMSLDAMTAIGPVISPDPSSDSAKGNVATPRLYNVNGTEYAFFQGTNGTSDYGNTTLDPSARPWRMCLATLNA